MGDRPGDGGRLGNGDDAVAHHTSSVGVLGAGLSGVLMGMQLRRSGIDDFTIYERQSDVGGTWFRNTYPGLHCDVPSHLYSYSFEPNPDWSMVYSSQSEIQAYIRSCAEKYDLLDEIRFSTTVDAACYDADSGVWDLEIAGGDTARHQVLVSATGGLTAPRFPRIDGLRDFAGPMWHSGAWRDDVDLSDLHVAVVGSAASAVQVVPAVVERARRVTVFSRTPNWVMPRRNRHYTAEERSGFSSDDDAVRRVRRQQYRMSLLWFQAFKRQQGAIDKLRQAGLANMRRAIDDPGLTEILTPDYDPGCKRILVSDDYYPALAQDHVRLVPEGVAALTADGIVAADGSETMVDAVIFCTGYRLGGREDGTPAIEVYGRDGRRLADVLAERAVAYRGVGLPGFPNYFNVCGVNGVVSYTSLFASAELETEFIVSLAQRVVSGEVTSMEPRADVTMRYTDEVQAELAQMSWTGNCTNFYLDREGRVVAFYPGTLGRMRRELRDVDDADFVIEAG